MLIPCPRGHKRRLKPYNQGSRPGFAATCLSFLVLGENKILATLSRGLISTGHIQKARLHEKQGLPPAARLLPPSHPEPQGPRYHFPPLCVLGNLVLGTRSGPESMALLVGGGCGAWPALALPPILGKAARRRAT